MLHKQREGGTEPFRKKKWSTIFEGALVKKVSPESWLDGHTRGPDIGYWILIGVAAGSKSVVLSSLPRDFEKNRANRLGARRCLSVTKRRFGSYMRSR